MEQWEKNYYISSIAGANNGSSLVVMSKGLFFTMSMILIDSLYWWLALIWSYWLVMFLSQKM